MRLPVPPSYLLAVLLLLSIAGCSKKDDPAQAKQQNVGSYTLNGRVTACSASVSISGNAAYDHLALVLVPTDAQYSTEKLWVIFEKPIGSSFSAYQPMGMYLLETKPGAAYSSMVYTMPDCQMTLSQTSSGGYSGTFSATPSISAVPLVLTAGVVTDAH